MGNTYFKHKSLHKYASMARGEDGVNVMNMVDLVLVKSCMLWYVQDVRVVRGIILYFVKLGWWMNRKK